LDTLMSSSYDRVKVNRDSVSPRIGPFYVISIYSTYIITHTHIIYIYYNYISSILTRISMYLTDPLYTPLFAREPTEGSVPVNGVESPLASGSLICASRKHGIAIFAHRLKWVWFILVPGLPTTKDVFKLYKHSAIANLSSFIFIIIPHLPGEGC
jgi:hypothetical protein